MSTPRVIAEYRASYDVAIDDEIVTASVRGHFHTGDRNAFPKVGDYVRTETTAAGKVVITDVLPRRNALSRETKEGETQVMVSNVDYLFIVMGLDNDFNLRRLERYLALAERSHVTPIILLNKVDMVSDTAHFQKDVAAVAAGVPIHFISAATGAGLISLAPYLLPDSTIVLLGSSGAGKSTLTNALLAYQVQNTSTVRVRDDRGTHTTTTRQLFVLPTGAALIDTPGLRELGVVAAAEEISTSFADVAALARTCQFTNCDHVKSQGCALQAAVEAGKLNQKRLASYLKLLSGEERIRYQRYGRS